MRDSWNVLRGLELATRRRRDGEVHRPIGSDPRTVDDIVRSISPSYEFYRNFTHLEPDRVSIYNDMDEAFQYVLISAAMEAFIEDACEPDPESGKCLWVESPNEMVVRELENLFETLDLEDRIEADLWNIGKYGDYFTYNRYNVKYGVFDLIPLEPRASWVHENEMREVTGYTIGPESEADSVGKKDPKYKPWDITHFKLKRHRAIDAYGTPFFINIRLIYKVLKLMEEQMTIYRMNLHPDRLVWKVPTGTANPEEARRALRMWKKELKQVTAINRETDNYISQYGPWAMENDIFFPMPEGNTEYGVEKFAGSSNSAEVLDLEYVRDLLFGGLRVPRGYMGLEDSQGYRSSDTLSQQSIKFARGVKRLRRPLHRGYSRISQIHLAIRGVDISDPRNRFKLCQPPPSYLDEAHRAELFAQRFQTVEHLMNIGQTISQSLGVDIKTFAAHVLKKYSGLDTTTIQSLLSGGDEVISGADPEALEQMMQKSQLSEEQRHVLQQELQNPALREVLEKLETVGAWVPDKELEKPRSQHAFPKKWSDPTDNSDHVRTESKKARQRADKEAKERHFALRQRLWETAAKAQERAKEEAVA